MSASAPVHQAPSVRSRCAYAAYLGTGLLALAFLALACGEGHPLLLLHATLAGIASALLRAHLAETGQLAACAEEDDAPAAHHTIAPPNLPRESAALLRRCTDLERLRGTPSFNPWELLEARRQLSNLQDRGN